jgi:hypothetical protein
LIQNAVKLPVTAWPEPIHGLAPPLSKTTAAKAIDVRQESLMSILHVVERLANPQYSTTSGNFFRIVRAANQAPATRLSILAASPWQAKFGGRTSRLYLDSPGQNLQAICRQPVVRSAPASRPQPAPFQHIIRTISLDGNP